LPVRVYYSFAPEDRDLVQEFEKHMRVLLQARIIEDWSAEEVAPGDEMELEALEHLQQAALILLLVSADFMASELCYSRDLPLALELEAKGKARVVPVFLRPTMLSIALFTSLACLPKNGEAVTLWENQDVAFTEIVEGIYGVIEEMCGPIELLVQGLVRIRKSSRQVGMKHKATERSNFLSRVRNAWITGKDAPGREVALTPGLERLPSGVARSWSPEVALPWPSLTFPLQSSPVNGDIVENYEEAGGDLLILGEPGAGKTTLLLQLASELLERAEKDQEQPMPAIFPLSSWAAHPRQPLMSWLVDALYEIYQVPRKLGKRWLENDLILLLLDGLDEVAEELRSACILAINSYRREHYGTSVVVCSRRGEYFAQDERIELQRAVMVQPLSEQQMDVYLARFGERLEPLRRRLQQDTILRDLIACPLLLNISIIAYDERDFAEISAEQEQKSHYQHLIRSYVQHMVKKRDFGERYGVERIDRWLSNLAIQMRKHNQTTFYLERINMSWLMEKRSQWLYRISSVILSIFLGWLVGIPVFGLIGWLSGKQLTSAIIGGVVGVVSFSVIGASMPIFNLNMPLIDAFVWSWRVFRQELFIILICILVGIFMGGADTKMVLVGGISGALFGGIFGVVVGVLNSGLAETMPELRRMEKPNQALWRSVRYSIFIVIFSICFGIIFALIGSRLGLAMASAFGFVGAMGLGGLVSVEHLILRVVMGVTGQMPWDVVGFLDEGVESGLLRRVGSGYMFMHGLLQDYFAEMGEKV
jgi:GTPase SAR1 family protein